jgi:hypothetical protein
MNQYDQAHLKRSTIDSSRATKSGKGRWTKPSSGVIKINWDTAMDTLIGKAGLGSIARDYEGRVVAMSSSIQQHITNPTTAETLAAWQVVVLGMQLGATYLELEGDALEVVQGLNQVDYCCGLDGPVLKYLAVLHCFGVLFEVFWFFFFRFFHVFLPDFFFLFHIFFWIGFPCFYRLGFYFNCLGILCFFFFFWGGGFCC